MLSANNFPKLSMLLATELSTKFIWGSDGRLINSRLADSNYSERFYRSAESSSLYFIIFSYSFIISLFIRSFSWFSFVSLLIVSVYSSIRLAFGADSIVKSIAFSFSTPSTCSYWDLSVSLSRFATAKAISTVLRRDLVTSRSAVAPAIYLSNY